MTVYPVYTSTLRKLYKNMEMQIRNNRTLYNKLSEKKKEESIEEQLSHFHISYST